MSKSVDPDTLSAIVISPNAWIGVDLDQLDQNILAAKSHLSAKSKICAIVKADAYGLGIENVMQSLMRGGIQNVGVANNSEAMAVRKSGFDGAMMRVRPATPIETELTILLGIEELVGTLSAAIRLSDIAVNKGRSIDVHLALDSNGLSRDGLELDTEQGQKSIKNILDLPGLKVVGVMTHFPNYTADKMAENLHQFTKDTDWLFANTNLMREHIVLHAAHSFGLLQLPAAHLDMVRMGAALFGCVGERDDIGHVMSLRSQVASCIAFTKGNTVGYDRSKVLDRDSVLANIPLGYSNGYSRNFSNKGEVLVRGCRAPIVGKISMNSLMIDITDLPQVVEGDEVVLFGPQKGQRISQAEIEQNSGTVLAENYTNWGNANIRRTMRHGAYLD